MLNVGDEPDPLPDPGRGLFSPLVRIEENRGAEPASTAVYASIQLYRKGGIIPKVKLVLWERALSRDSWHP